MIRSIALVSVLAALVQFAPSQDEAPTRPSVSSEVRTTEAGERILVQEVWLDAPVAEVWAAYTTDEGWTAWASPKAEIDLRVGGTVRTHYGADADIGDPGTNLLHIVNYVPLELLTLRAELSENWPEIMQEDAENLSNVVLFQSLGPERTRLVSYGIGYRDSPEYDSLLTFFVSANEGLYRGLKRWVEEGERTEFGQY